MLSFIIEALLVTNIWILLYNNLLRFLDIRFPTVVSTEFIRSGAVSEPFEISLYLAISIFMVIFLYFLHNHFLKPSRENISLKPSLQLMIFKYTVLILLIVLFIKNIGAYPMGRDNYPYAPRDKSIYMVYFLLFTGVIGTLILELTIFTSILTRVKKSLTPFLYLFLIIIIAFFTFEPRFPMVGHDYSFFLGPIWEILHGKTIYTQVPSQYGFLSILFFSLLFKMRLLNFSTLPILVWLLYVLQYFLVFHLLNKTTKSFFLAVLGLFSIITINYFSLYHLPAAFPQIGPLRWLPLLIPLVLFSHIKKIDSPKLTIVIGILCIWIIDTGIALVLAYLFTLFILKISKNIDWKRIIKAITVLFGTTLSLFITINIIHLILGYSFINLLSIFLKIQKYGKAGFGMLPIETYVYFWIVILIYFASIIYIFREKKVKIPVSGIELFNQLLLFSANISLFASVYYVGRSHPHNLFTISLFPLLTLFMLISIFYTSIQSKKTKILIGILLFLIFIIYPVFQRQEVITELIMEKVKRIQSGNIFKPELNDILKLKYPNEISLINNNIPDKKIVILSADDTYLFYLTGKENLMMDNSQIAILTQNDMDFSLQDVYKLCPDKIVVDCTFMKKCERSNTFVEGFFSIQPLILNRIQEKCNIQYEPVSCTNQLCISQSKKI